MSQLRILMIEFLSLMDAAFARFYADFSEMSTSTFNALSIAFENVSWLISILSTIHGNETISDETNFQRQIIIW